jgi:hypothetical protein
MTILAATHYPPPYENVRTHVPVCALHISLFSNASPLYSRQLLHHICTAGLYTLLNQNTTNYSRASNFERFNVRT